MNSAKAVLLFPEGETLARFAWTCVRIIQKGARSIGSNDFLDEMGPEFELQRFPDLPANILCVRGSRFCWPIVFSFGVFQARL